MKTTILLWNIVFVLATAFTAENTEPAQVISLSDGAKITFLGITYGKHHVVPNYEAMGGNIRTGHWIDRSNDVTVAWIEIEHNPAQFPNYMLFASDKADTNGVGFRAENRAINHVRDGVEVEGYELEAYPRWDKQFHLRVYSIGPYIRRLSSEKFLATNPDLKDIGNAVAETLPATRTDGDLTVTLTNFVSGAPQPPYIRDDRFLPLDPVRMPAPAPNDPVNQCVRFGFDLKQNGHSATNWQLASVAVSDAVSNYVDATVLFQDNDDASHRYPFVKTPADGYNGYVFWPSLWPNEPAWNVRMEFTRDSGFSEDEIVTFTNLSVEKATENEYRGEESSIAEQSVQEARLKIVPPLARAGSPSGREYLHVVLYANPDPGSAMRLTLIRAADGEGHNFPIPQFPTPFVPGVNGRYSFTLSDTHGVKTLNFKFALHRSRYVTFTVKPNRQ